MVLTTVLEEALKGEAKFIYLEENSDFFDKYGWKQLPNYTSPLFASGKKFLTDNTIVYSSNFAKGYSGHEPLKIALADFVKEIKKMDITVASLFIEGVIKNSFITSDYTDILSAVYLADYSFDKYKSHKDESSAGLSLEVVVSPDNLSSIKKLLPQIEEMVNSVNIAKNLVNEPGNFVYPQKLVEKAEEIAQETGLELEVLEELDLKKGEYNGLLTVGRGSQYPPRMIILRYSPEVNTDSHIALVGKGVTFDSGGVSLKSGKDMHEMKGDMAGAAAVLGAIRAIALAKPSVKVTAIVVTAENMIGSKAARPGDIYFHKSGKSIQVDNTDAEGRLILIDGLHRAGEEGADCVIDIATLTGSAERALGQSVAALFGNDQELIDDIIKSGHASGESFWQLPLVQEYRKQLETPVADIRNIGGANGGAITAALFLQEFLPAKLQWAHLDIAGLFYFEKGWKYHAPGSTGFGVQTLVNFVCQKNIKGVMNEL